MEKLIELLNEWYQERYKTNPHFNKFEDYGGNDYGYFIGDDKLMVETEVRTKKYGFIKWLVDNDKVDLKKANNIDYGPLFDFYYDRDALIMALSINDEPIKFLISILK